ncbi:hypothetical protein BC833DRAFT_600813 [Globomyces pollinis-pini]|nr:hypothetical protein BC833DRAFT_600813 [Globomyces pollinis-pini]
MNSDRSDLQSSYIIYSIISGVCLIGFIYVIRRINRYYSDQYTSTNPKYLGRNRKIMVHQEMYSSFNFGKRNKTLRSVVLIPFENDHVIQKSQIDVCDSFSSISIDDEIVIENHINQVSSHQSRLNEITLYNSLPNVGQYRESIDLTIQQPSQTRQTIDGTIFNHQYQPESHTFGYQNKSNHLISCDNLNHAGSQMNHADNDLIRLDQQSFINQGANIQEFPHRTTSLACKY